ncbi:MAG: Hsp20/alpha crystallin family protein [Oscillospiraceae bacterium]
MFDLMPYGSSSLSLGDLFDNMALNFFKDGDSSLNSFRSDILDKGDKYLLQAELPGFNRDDIKLNLNGDTLTISAEHSESKDNSSENYLRRERNYGSYSRNFDVSSIKADEIEASYKDGVLELELPKKEPSTAALSRRIEIH